MNYKRLINYIYVVFFKSLLSTIITTLLISIYAFLLFIINIDLWAILSLVILLGCIIGVINLNLKQIIYGFLIMIVPAVVVGFIISLNIVGERQLFNLLITIALIFIIANPFITSISKNKYFKTLLFCILGTVVWLFPTYIISNLLKDVGLVQLLISEFFILFTYWLMLYTVTLLSEN